MKILIEEFMHVAQNGKKTTEVILMEVAQSDLTEDWHNIIEKVQIDMITLGVLQAGYNQWHWPLSRKDEAEKYATIFALKHS